MSKQINISPFSSHDKKSFISIKLIISILHSPSSALPTSYINNRFLKTHHSIKHFPAFRQDLISQHYSTLSPSCQAFSRNLVTSRAALKTPQVAMQVVPRAAPGLANHLDPRLAPGVQLQLVAQALPAVRRLAPRLAPGM